MKTGKEMIGDERQRQMIQEGYSLRSDEKYVDGELLKAAECYYRWPANPIVGIWPWSDSDWKPKDRVSNLIRAGALYLAAANQYERRLINDMEDICVAKMGVCAQEIDQIIEALVKYGG